MPCRTCLYLLAAPGKYPTSKQRSIFFSSSTSEYSDVGLTSGVCRVLPVLLGHLIFVLCLNFGILFPTFVSFCCDFSNLFAMCDYLNVFDEKSVYVLVICSTKRHCNVISSVCQFSCQPLVILAFEFCSSLAIICVPSPYRHMPSLLILSTLCGRF